MLITEDNKGELLKEIAAADSLAQLDALYKNKLYAMVAESLKELGLELVDKYIYYRLTGGYRLLLSPVSGKPQTSLALLKKLQELASHTLAENYAYGTVTGNRDALAEMKAEATDMMRKVRPAIDLLDSVFRTRLMLMVAAMDKATAEYPGMPTVRTVHKVDNRWVDSENNSWDARLYTEECAAELSKDLINCRDCIDCTNCRDCCYCEHCKDCQSCSGCKHCSLCTRCHYCTSCLSCMDCHVCSRCESCLYCRDCTRVVYGSYYSNRVCNGISTSCRECPGGGDCQPGTNNKHTA